MIRRGFSHAADAFDDAFSGRARGTVDVEVRELVATAELLCRSAVAEPSPEFSSALRARLMAEAADVLVAAPRPAATAPAVVTATGTRRRRAVGVSAALVGCLGTVGLVTSSATAVPGDVLYPVKRGVENVQVALHRDPESRGEYRLQQARERLAEVVALQDDATQVGRIAPTLESFTEEAETGSTELFDTFRADPSSRAVDTVNDFIAAASVDLAAMAATMPEEGIAGWTLATDAVTALADSASTLCATCDPADVSTLTQLVQSLATGGAGADGSPVTPESEAPSGSTPTTAPRVPVPSAAPTGGLPTVAVPTTPSGTPVPDVLGDTVDDLLGEDGLVPNVLGGLLGQPKP